MSSLKQFVYLTRLNRPIGIYLLLWPTLVALWIAGHGKPSPWIVGIFTMGVIVMRSAGCILNDWADRNWDKLITRTKNRPLTTGAVSERTALVWCLGLLTLAALLIIPLNLKTKALSLIALLLAALYPFMKRYTHLPQAFLGVSFGCSIPMAFSAQNQPLLTPIVALLLGIVMTWVLVYDTQYAMVDREDDIKAGIKSTAILWGTRDCCAIGVLQGLTLLQLGLLGFCLHAQRPYYCALLLITLLFIHQQIQIQHREPKACLQAFLNNHYVGLLWFLGIILGSYKP